MRLPLVVLGCGATAFLTLTSWAAAQETDLQCTGEGANPPHWYAEPPVPPPSVYQAEARSGGCRDAEAAQTLAARVAARLLLQARSPSSVLIEVRMARWQRGSEGRREIDHDYEVLEQALTQKVLERSWVHRQETRWTAEGRVEHFLILRADTSAVREVAAEELAELTARDHPGSLTGKDFEWISLDGTRGTVERPATRATPSSAVAVPQGNWSRIPEPPALRRFIIDWQASPEGRDPESWPGEGRMGLALGTDGAHFHGAIGVRLAIGGQRLVNAGNSGPAAAIIGERRLDALLLGGIPWQFVPVYGGYRYQWLRAGSETGTRDKDAEALIVGLGYPLFTELADARLRNAYLEAAVLPDFQSVAGGGRVVLVEGANAGIAAVFGGTMDLLELGRGMTAGGWEPGAAQEGLFLNRLTMEGGVELRFADHMGVFALGRFERAKLSRLQNPDERSYGLAARSLETLGDPSTKAGLWVGLRLCF